MQYCVSCRILCRIFELWINRQSVKEIYSKICINLFTKWVKCLIYELRSRLFWKYFLRRLNGTRRVSQDQNSQQICCIYIFEGLLWSKVSVDDVIWHNYFTTNSFISYSVKIVLQNGTGFKKVDWKIIVNVILYSNIYYI